MMKILISAFVACLLSSVCFGQSWSTLPVDLLIPMNTSPTYLPGTALTTAIANSGTVSNVCTVGTECYFSSLPVGAFEVGANHKACSNLGPVQMNGIGGTLYPAQSLNYNSYAHLDSANGAIGMFQFRGISSKYITVTTCLTLSFPLQRNGNDWDMIMIQDGSGLYADMQFNDACTSSSAQIFGVRIETHVVNPKSACVPLQPAQTYFLSMNWDLVNGMATLFVYTPTGTFIGSTYVVDTSTGSLNDVRLFSNESGTNPGTYSYYQNTMMRWASTPPSGTATFTSGSTAVTGSAFVRDNSWNNAFIIIGGTPYTIASVQSSASLTLTTPFSGTTGNASYTVEPPLFWTSSATVLPPTGLTATVQ